MTAEMDKRAWRPRFADGPAICLVVVGALLMMAAAGCGGSDAQPSADVESDPGEDTSMPSDTLDADDPGDEDADTDTDTQTRDVHRPDPEPLPPEIPAGVPPRPGSVALRVIGPDGPLDGAILQVGAAVARTDHRGDAHVPRISPGPQVVRASADGFSSQLRRVTIESGVELVLELSLAPSPEPVLFASDEEGQAVAGPLTMDVPVGAVARADGSAYSGQIALTLQDYDPFDPEQAARYPAELEARLADGEEGMLETFGVLEATLRDEEGMLLQVAPGQNLPLRRAIPNDVGLDVGDEVPMWWLDAATGLWQEAPGVIATVVEVDGQRYMETALPHLSVWNFDVFFGGRCSIALRADPTDPGLPLGSYRVRIEGPAGVHRTVRTGVRWWDGESSEPLRFIQIGPGIYTLTLLEATGSDEPLEVLQVTHTCPGENEVAIEVPNAVLCAPGDPECLPEGSDVLVMEARNGKCPTRLRGQVRGVAPQTEWTTVPADGILRGYDLSGLELQWRWLDGASVVTEGTTLFPTCAGETCHQRWEVDVEEEFAYYPAGGCRPAPCTECTGCLEVEVMDAFGEPEPDVRLDLQEPIGLSYTSGSDGGFCAEAAGAGDTFVVYTAPGDLLGSAVLPRDGTCEGGGCARRRVVRDGAEWRCPEGSAFLPIRTARRMGIENVGYRDEVLASDADGPDDARGFVRRVVPDDVSPPAPVDDPTMLADFENAVHANGYVDLGSPWAAEVLSRDLAGVEHLDGLRIGFGGHRGSAANLLDGFSSMDPVLQMRMRFAGEWPATGESHDVSEVHLTLALYDIDTTDGISAQRWSRAARSGTIVVQDIQPERIEFELHDVQFECEDCDDLAPDLREVVEAMTYSFRFRISVEDRTQLTPSFVVQRSNPFVGAWYAVHRFDDDRPWLFGPTGSDIDVEEERQELAATRWCIPTSGAPAQMVGERFPGVLAPLSPLLAAEGNRYGAWEGAASEDARPWLQIKPRWWDVAFVEAMYDQALGRGQWRDPVEDVATVIGEATNEAGTPTPVRRAELVDVEGQVVHEAVVINPRFQPVDPGQSALFFFPGIPAGTSLEDRLQLRVYAGSPEEELLWMRQSFVPFAGGVLVPLD